MLAHLRGIVEPVEIRDPQGHILGHYTPLVTPEEEELYRKAAELFDPEEMERIAASNEKTYTTAEVLEYLKSLEKSQ